MAEKTTQMTVSEPSEEARNDGISVVLWTRRPVCGPRTTVIDRLSSLRTAGMLDDFTVRTWPDQLVVSDQGHHDDILATIEEYENWAAEHGLSLRPPFERRTASLLVGGSKEVLTTPLVAAAVYDADDLVGVYPCRDGSRTWTVVEFLDAAETGTELPHERGDRPVPETGE